MFLVRYAIVVFCLVAAIPATAQDLPQPTEAGKEHQWLQQFVGEWSSESKAEAAPGQPAMECSGTIKSKMIGGLWVVNEMQTEVGGATMIGLQTIGYDPEKKKYVGTWVDSMANFMWKYEGTVDSTGKRLTLDADGPDFFTPGKTTKYQDIYEFTSADTMSITSRMMDDDGKWITFMTGTAKRITQPKK